MKHLHVGLGLLVLPILLGCPKVEPCNSIQDGDKIEVTLVGEVEEYIDYEPLPSCGFADQPPSFRAQNGKRRRAGELHHSGLSG